jgi:GAF domain-containing protein
MRTSTGHDPGLYAAGHEDALPTASQTSADSFAVPGFDAVVRLVSRSLGVPLVSLVLNGGSAYWFADGTELPAHDPRTLHPLHRQAAHHSAPHVVLDTLLDERFHEAALDLAATPGPIRFFASEPVFTLTGQQIGALCVMDLTPRIALTENEQVCLRDAASHRRGVA